MQELGFGPHIFFFKCLCKGTLRTSLKHGDYQGWETSKCGKMWHFKWTIWHNSLGQEKGRSPHLTIVGALQCPKPSSCNLAVLGALGGDKLLVQGNKGVFQVLSCPGQLGQGYERTFSASAAFRACGRSESATAKWNLLVVCHLRVAISCMCLVGCQPLVCQTLVRKPLFVMN